MFRMSLSFNDIKNAIDNSNFPEKEYEILRTICEEKVRSKGIEKYIVKAQEILEDFEEYEDYVLNKGKFKSRRSKVEKSSEQIQQEIDELKSLVANIDFTRVELKKFLNDYENEHFIVEFVLKSQVLAGDIKKYYFCWQWEHDNRREESESSTDVLVNGKDVDFSEVHQEMNLKVLEVSHLHSLINWIYGIFPCNLDIEW